MDESRLAQDWLSVAAVLCGRIVPSTGLVGGLLSDAFVGRSPPDGLVGGDVQASLGSRAGLLSLGVRRCWQGERRGQP